MAPLSELWHRSPTESSGPEIAFVLSGGAAMGALQVGMLRALLERRILPDLILGCSVGAINGVVLAGEPSLATVGRMQDIWMDLVDRDLLPTGLVPSTMQLLRKGGAMSSNDGVRALLDDVLPVAHFEDLAVEFQCAATNVDEATEHWFTSGPLAEPVLASSSIPAVFPMVEIDGVRYFDGAVVDDVPVQRAVDLGAKKIFILQVGGVDRPRPDPRRPLDMALLAYWVARRHRFLEDLGRVPEDVEVVILPHGDPTPVRYNDLSRSAQLMDIAYRASADHLDALADGRLGQTFGPVSAKDPNQPTRHGRPDEKAEMDAAHHLYTVARESVGAEDSSDDTRSPDDMERSELKRRLGDRAEAIGPGMRALVERIRDRGGSPFIRETDSSESDEQVDVDQTIDR